MRGPVACQESNDEEMPGENAARNAWNTRPSLPAPEREEIARIIKEADWHVSTESAAGLAFFLARHWPVIRRALSRPPENVDHRATEPAALRSAGRSDKPILPRELTAENGAKAALIGEFHETYELHERGAARTIDVPISWTTIKAIWKAAVAHFDKNPPHIPVVSVDEQARRDIEFKKLLYAENHDMRRHLEQIEYSLRKDSLCDAERIESARLIVKAALSQSPAVSVSDTEAGQ